MIRYKGLLALIPLLITVGVLFTVNFIQTTSAGNITGSSIHLTLNDVSGPALNDYIGRALDFAKQHN